MIIRPDKGSGVVILDKTFYEKKILKLIIDVTKFKELNEDPTFTREGLLQCFLRKVKDIGLFDDNTYKQIYPSGSKLATIYGLPKTHRLRSNDFHNLFVKEIQGVSANDYLLVLYDVFIQSF